MNKFLIIGVILVLVVGIGVSFSVSNESLTSKNNSIVLNPNDNEVEGHTVRLSETVSMSGP